MKKVIISMLLVLGMAMSANASDLVVDMPLDNLSAEDVSGNQNDGIKYCPMTAVDDRDGNESGAMRFDGDGDYIVIPLTATYSVEDEYTLSFWLRRQPTSKNAFVMYSNNVYLRLDGDNANYPGRLMFHNTYAYDMPMNEWVHIVCTSKANDKRTIWVNGELADSSPLTQFQSPEMDLTIGARHSSTFTGDEFTGDLDDVKIYNRALSESEIQELAGLNQEVGGSVYGDLKKAMFHFNKKSTDLQIHANTPVLEGLNEGPAVMIIQVIQGDEVIEIIMDAELIQRGRNLMNK